MKKLFTCLTLLLLLISACSQDQNNQDLEANFKVPPVECKPKTWMHAVSGNMSKE